MLHVTELMSKDDVGILLIVLLTDDHGIEATERWHGVNMAIYHGTVFLFFPYHPLMDSLPHHDRLSALHESHNTHSGKIDPCGNGPRTHPTFRSGG